MGNRYRQMERMMTYALCANLFMFILFLIASGFATIWLKTICAIFSILISLLCFGYLYITKEWLRRRSLWMSTAAGALFVCTVFSLILQFPSPVPGT